MTTTKEKTYYFSIVTIVFSCLLTLILIGLFSFVCFGLVYVLTNFDHLEQNYFLLIFCLIFSFIFGLLLMEAVPTVYKYTRFYLQKIPALILTSDQLIDNINSQIYKWTDIKTISTKTSLQGSAAVSFISISLFYPDKFIDKIQNSYKRRVARINEKYLTGAFSIQPNIIKCKNSELLKDLICYWNDKK